MNRSVIFGVALFFAIVGLALIGLDNTAVAGHSSHGCDDCEGDCEGDSHGCISSLLGCLGCHGCAASSCCAPALLSCCGCGDAAPAADDGEADADAEESSEENNDDVPEAPPEAEASFDRTPTIFRIVSFRR